MKPTPIWYSLIMVLVAMLAVTVAGVLYTGYVDRKREAAEREADRRWCTLLVHIDDNNRRNPSPTETGRRFALIIRGMRLSFGCGPEDVAPIPTTTP